MHNCVDDIGVTLPKPELARAGAHRLNVDQLCSVCKNNGLQALCEASVEKSCTSEICLAGDKIHSEKARIAAADLFTQESGDI